MVTESIESCAKPLLLMLHEFSFQTGVHTSAVPLPLATRSTHMTSVNRIFYFFFLHQPQTVRVNVSIGYMWFPVFPQNAGGPAATDQFMSSLDKNNDEELNLLGFWQLIGPLASKHGGGLANRVSSDTLSQFHVLRCRLCAMQFFLVGYQPNGKHPKACFSFRVLYFFNQ